MLLESFWWGMGLVTNEVSAVYHSGISIRATLEWKLRSRLMTTVMFLITSFSMWVRYTCQSIDVTFLRS